jgi:hypothetical protein
MTGRPSRLGWALASMKLPYPDRAVVDIRRIRDYCLNPEHRRGRHKARVFAAALGITSEHSEELQNALLAAARDGRRSPRTEINTVNASC